MRGVRIDLSSTVPIYQQIADEIRGLIAKGELPEGAELPSVRRLGAEVGVNQNTVARAYRILSDEGVIELRHGAIARVGKAPASGSLGADDLRAIEAVVGRAVVAGVPRAALEEALEGVLDQYYGGEEPPHKRKKS